MMKYSVDTVCHIIVFDFLPTLKSQFQPGGLSSKPILPLLFLFFHIITSFSFPQSNPFPFHSSSDFGFFLDSLCSLWPLSSFTIGYLPKPLIIITMSVSLFFLLRLCSIFVNITQVALFVLKSSLTITNTHITKIPLSRKKSIKPFKELFLVHI